jgi:hypothetical protein
MLPVILLILGAALLLLMILRFVQPEVVYWLRRALAGVRRNRLFLSLDEGQQPNTREYVELSLNDLRPEGVPKSYQEVLARVTKIRELYSLLDLSRADVRDLPAAHQSNICIIELSNMVAALARDLEPSSKVLHHVAKADKVLRSLAQARGDRSISGDSGEDKIAEHFRTIPMSIEQVNELLIATIYGMAYRLEVQEDNTQAH